MWSTCVLAWSCSCLASIPLSLERGLRHSGPSMPIVSFARCRVQTLHVWACRGENYSSLCCMWLNSEWFRFVLNHARLVYKFVDSDILITSWTYTESLDLCGPSLSSSRSIDQRFGFIFPVLLTNALTLACVAFDVTLYPYIQTRKKAIRSCLCSPNTLSPVDFVCYLPPFSCIVLDSACQHQQTWA